MVAVKVLSLIFLAAYLILMGLTSLTGVNLSMMANDVIQLFGIAAGVLMLISMKSFSGHR